MRKKEITTIEKALDALEQADKNTSRHIQRMTRHDLNSIKDIPRQANIGLSRTWEKHPWAMSAAAVLMFGVGGYWAASRLSKYRGESHEWS